MEVIIEELSRNLKLPKKATDGSGAYDLFLTEDIKILPGRVYIIPLGFKTCFSSDFVAKIYIRSSQGKIGLRLANQVGIIDSDYNQEWKLLLFLDRSFPRSTVRLKRGERIAQVIFERTYPVEFIAGKVSQTTDRDGGFGSTGA